ncbi:hypothetical protein [Candidatus Lokiarchaeum ossiferum]|uniref:hypothetical protein n=1 Tax=Candidatus Lokiarchaeum ossiferum TaxID=2951803 RepID=UPI00352CA129
MEIQICEKCNIKMKFVGKRFELLEESMDMDEMTDGQNADYIAANLAGEQSESNGEWVYNYECPSCHLQRCFT